MRQRPYGWPSLTYFPFGFLWKMYADLGDSWVPGLGNWMGDIVITETGNTGRGAGVQGRAGGQVGAW